LALVTLATVTLVGGLSLPALADDEVTLAQARSELTVLLEQAQDAAARVDELSAQREAVQARAEVVAASVSRSQTQVTTATAELGGFAAALHRHGLVDPAVFLMAEDDPAEALATTSQYEVVAGGQVRLLQSLARDRLDLAAQQADLEADTARLGELTSKVAQAQRVVSERAEQAEALVARLEAEQQREVEAQRQRIAALEQQASRAADRQRPPAGYGQAGEGSTGRAAPPAASAPARLGTGCVVPDPTSGGCITPTLASLMDQVSATFGSMPTYCWRGGGGDHAQGRACDVMMAPGGTYPGPDATARGWAIATWMQANAGRLGIDYVIWQGRIWIASRAEQGWRPYNGYGPTAGHYDHVHVSVRR
jgi:hypothetical protein